MPWVHPPVWKPFTLSPPCPFRCPASLSPPLFSAGWTFSEVSVCGGASASLKALPDPLAQALPVPPEAVPHPHLC